MRKFLLSIIFCTSILSINSLNAQTLLCDSIVLKLHEFHGGNVQWYKSTDATNWTEINGAVSQEVTVFSNTNTYYRATISEGTCDPYFSDTIFNIKPQDWTIAEKNLIYSASITTLMPVMNIYVQPDSIILRTPSTNIAPCDDSVLSYLQARMLKTVKNPAHPGVGIAAPQVGINRNATWIQRYDKGTFTSHPFEFYINPKITAYSDTVKLKSDGCLSVPNPPTGQDFSYRAIWINVEYDLPDGTHKKERINHEYTAHIFQHEIDHLNAIMYLDRMIESNASKFVIISDQPALTPINIEK